MRLTVRLAMISLTLALTACAAKVGDAADPGDSTLRRRMVDQQLRERGIEDTCVLQVMESVPRHLFIPEALRQSAYHDGPVPVGWGQTISQPYIVAFMTESLRLRPTDRVLEIGTGSGYQAAVLSGLVSEVFTIEIVKPLGEQAQRLLKRLGYKNVEVAIGDGYKGWPQKAPFDAIMVTAAPDHVPQPLLDQLAEGGRLILPLGSTFQELVSITKRGGRYEREKLLPVRFVPMTGEAQRQ